MQQDIEIDVLLQKPISFAIVWEDGTREVIPLPRLGVDGLAPWIDELTLQRRTDDTAALDKIRKKFNKMEELMAEKAIQADRAVMSDLAIPVQTAPGIHRVIELSLSMTDLPPDKQKIVANHICSVAHIANSLSQRLSTLFVTGEKREDMINPAATEKGPSETNNPFASQGQSDPS